MAIGMSASTLGLVAAGAVLGLAFGPETPASSALLARLGRPQQRPLIFSVRQTGNQIGAIIGSLALPTIALAAPALGFAAIAALALLLFVAFLALRRLYEAPTLSAPAPPRAGPGTWQVLRQAPGLRALALASMPFSAMQLALNAYLVTLAVDRLALEHVRAGLLLAIAQLGGLIGRLFWGLIATRRLGSRAPCSPASVSACRSVPEPLRSPDPIGPHGRSLGLPPCSASRRAAGTGSSSRRWRGWPPQAAFRRPPAPC
jgi:MFS family permease